MSLRHSSTAKYVLGSLSCNLWSRLPYLMALHRLTRDLEDSETCRKQFLCTVSKLHPNGSDFTKTLSFRKFARTLGNIYICNMCFLGWFIFPSHWTKQNTDALTARMCLLVLDATDGCIRDSGRRHRGARRRCFLPRLGVPRPHLRVPICKAKRQVVLPWGGLRSWKVSD